MISIARSLILPKQKFPQLEAREFTRKQVTTKVANSWIKENCNDNGQKNNSNTTKEERAAIKSLKERVAAGSLVIMPTDKSGKFSVMSMNTYEDMGQK